MSEPILQETLDRFILFPIHYDDVWSMYKKAVASFWVPEEIDLKEDIDDWENKLTDHEKHFISYVLAFFANADSIVNENLAARFLKEVQIPEAKQFYTFQIAIEGIHTEMYGILIDTFIKENKDKLFNAIHTIPSVQKKAQWALKWLNSDQPFAKRLIAFAIVEGVFFSGSFCSIYWLKKRGLMPGLGASNELISKDEGLHTDFACLLYSYLNNRLTQEDIEEILREGVECEKEFVVDAIQVPLIGMNNQLMCQYIEFVADRLIYQLGYKKIYNASNPFDWMVLQSIEGKTNFFEKRVTDYSKSGVALNAKEFNDMKFTTDADF